MDIPASSHLSNRGAVFGPLSEREFQRSTIVTPGGSMRAAPYFPPHPPYAERGFGCWVTDVDGRRIFDCANNFFSLVHGHAFEPVLHALRETIDGGTAFGLPTTYETDLAEEIREIGRASCREREKRATQTE